MTAWLIVTAHVHDRAGFMADFAPGAAALVEKLEALCDPRAGSAAEGRWWRRGRVDRGLGLVG